MKLILTHEVTNLGEPGDIVDVRDGYGRNYLLPRGFAIRWTRGAGREIDSIRKARQTRTIHDRDDAVALKERLELTPVDVAANAGKEGRLFGGVTVSEIAAALQGVDVEVDKRRIEIGNPIKSLGTHTVSVRVHPEVTAQLTVNVIPA